MHLGLSSEKIDILNERLKSYIYMRDIQKICDLINMNITLRYYTFKKVTVKPIGNFHEWNMNEFIKKSIGAKKLSKLMLFMNIVFPRLK